MVASAQGHDYSNFQGKLPLQTGDSFVFAKASESTSYQDPDFQHYWDAAWFAKKPRGAYHFFHPAIGAAAQARYFYNTVKAQGIAPGDMLVADVEITAGLTSPDAERRAHLPFEVPHERVGVPAVAGSAKLFLDTLAGLAGPQVPVLCYTDQSVGITLTGCGRYALWAAWYSSTPPPAFGPWGNWTFWQYTSSPLDTDAFNGTAAVLNGWLDSYRHPGRTAEDMTPATCYWENRQFLFLVAPFGGTPRGVYWRSKTRQADGSWKNDQQGWTSIGGQVVSGLTAAASPAGDITVAGVGTDEAFWHNTRPAGQQTFSGWASDGGKSA